MFVIIDIQRETPRLTEPTDEVVRCYRLENNTLTPVNGLPPESDVGPEKSPGGIVKPDVLADSPDCRPDGTATLWYKPHDGEWKSVTFDVGGSDSYLYRMGTFQGKIVGASEDPYSLFLYDPATDTKTVHCPIGLHAYAFQEFEGKVYYVGYSGAPIYQWDPYKPCSIRTPSPEGIAAEKPTSEPNPRHVVGFHRQRRSYAIVLAADGRMNVPCSALVESFPGGLLGWYDPGTGESGGIREGFEYHSGGVAQLAMNGRYVVVATRPWPQSETADSNSCVLTYDTQEQKVVGRVRPVRGCVEPSDLVEWKPSKIIGKFEESPPDVTKETWAPEKATTTFYLMDVTTQTCRVTLKLGRCSHGKILRLPDGKIACLSWKTVIVIDPADWSFEAVGEFDCKPPPRDWLLLNNDLYAILDTQIVRIKNFHVERDP